MFYASTLDIFIVYGFGFASVFDAAAAWLPPKAWLDALEFPVIFSDAFDFLFSVALLPCFELLFSPDAAPPKKLPLNLPPMPEKPIVDSNPPAACAKL